MTETDMLSRDAEFVVMMRAFDESFSQIVYSKSSYKADEIKWGEKFVYPITRDERGMTVDVAKLSTSEPKPLNP